MTDSEVHAAVMSWLASVTGVMVIKAHSGGTRPPKPYIMVNLVRAEDLRQHATLTEYADTGDVNEDGKPIISAAPVMEIEWFFSIHAYGDNHMDLLRKVRSAAHTLQRMEALNPALTIQEVGAVNSVPEYVNEAWETRAQVDLYVRGIVRDGAIVDEILEGAITLGPTDRPGLVSGEYSKT